MNNMITVTELWCGFEKDYGDRRFDLVAGLVTLAIVSGGSEGASLKCGTDMTVGELLIFSGELTESRGGSVRKGFRGRLED